MRSGSDTIALHAGALIALQEHADGLHPGMRVALASSADTRFAEQVGCPLHVHRLRAAPSLRDRRIMRRVCTSTARARGVPRGAGGPRGAAAARGGARALRVAAAHARLGGQGHQPDRPPAAALLQQGGLALPAPQGSHGCAARRKTGRPQAPASPEPPRPASSQPRPSPSQPRPPRSAPPLSLRQPRPVGRRARAHAPHGGGAGHTLQLQAPATGICSRRQLQAYSYAPLHTGVPYDRMLFFDDCNW